MLIIYFIIFLFQDTSNTIRFEHSIDLEVYFLVYRLWRLLPICLFISFFDELERHFHQIECMLDHF
jgi:hypothetical protein